MSSRDYLVDHFRQLGEVLAAIFEKRKSAKYNDALEIVNQALDGWLKVDVETFENYMPEQIEALILNPLPDLEHQKAISELFYQKFIIFREMKQKEKALIAAKNAAYLFEKIEKLTENYSFEVEQQIVRLQNYISGANNK